MTNFVTKFFGLGILELCIVVVFLVGLDMIKDEALIGYPPRSIPIILCVICVLAMFFLFVECFWV